MDYQVSARKYRPGTFSDVIGQPHVVQALVNAVSSKRIAHAFLFSGTRGVGKTTIARILAKALNCEQGPTGTPCNRCVNCTEIAQGTAVDVVEIDGASNTSVDDVREIRENVKFTPFRGAYRVYIIDEVHMLSNSAFNALLKTLEEPPAHVVFIFATTELHKIPATILSRCQHYSFRRIPRAEIVERLALVAAQDDVSIEPRSLTLVARASEGSMRDALSLFDQAIALCGKTVNHDDLEQLLGAVPVELVRSFIQALERRDSLAAVEVIAALLEQGQDLRAFCADVVEYLRNLLVASVVPSVQELRGLVEAADEELTLLLEEASRFSSERLQQVFQVFSQAEDGLRLSIHPRFALEAAAIRATTMAEATAPIADSSMQARVAMPPPGKVAPSSSPAPVRTKTPTGPAANSLNQAKPRPTDPTSGRGNDRSRSGLARPLKSPDARSVSPEGLEGRRGTTKGDEPSVADASALSPKGERSQQEQRSIGPPQEALPESQQLPPLALEWEHFVECMAATHPSIASFLERGRLVEMEHGEIVLGYAKTETVARAMMEKEDNLRIMRSVAEALAGRPVTVRIAELADATPAGPTMAEARAARRREETTLLFERTRAHPLVKEALALFGADVVEVRRLGAEKEAQV
ncbi:DNA polymerase III subunits gamma and tau [Nitrospira tepida]|uniref:DNA polymerase III subunit gamma/tau n=1 Tax=Nitrospira tepida TaxID=2973512 RepID=A0AA86MW12_9BACT|nr:DNA polymerase III subunit gamma/tau [Nitrospira tepida]CAI4030012.1 DNA polymerase III subunits gamma and tau [Nitrospira tepida]